MKSVINILAQQINLIRTIIHTIQAIQARDCRSTTTGRIFEEQRSDGSIKALSRDILIILSAVNLLYSTWLWRIRAKNVGNWANTRLLTKRAKVVTPKLNMPTSCAP